MTPVHAAQGEAALVVGNRTIHVFRTSLGAFSAVERADGARHRIERALEVSGEGWTSVKSTELGFLILLDGKPMFTVAPGDARKLSDESPEDMANAASRVLQTVWRESRESRNPQVTLYAVLMVVAAATALALALFLIFRSVRALRRLITSRGASYVAAQSPQHLLATLVSMFLGLASRACMLLGWAVGLFVIFVFLTYSLEQFVLTRPMAEGLSHSLANLLTQILGSVARAVPGMIVAVIIFLAAWVATQASTEVFNHVTAGEFKLGMLDAHTAPATRRIANTLIWLFALAMAYPYLPGAQTEAFKGLSVILGLMVSIGASGLVGQVASGVILVYTRALSLGEYVKIQDSEGTVTELGLFVTRLRTGLGEEVSLPNALVLANITRNYSRAAKGSGVIVDAAVTIGYDTPWRQVHAMLLEAAAATTALARDPAPYVVQTALSDFYAGYKLVSYATVNPTVTRAQIASDLHAAIQDVFNRHGVQIMSPHYQRDPVQPKTVAQEDWYTAPAVPPGSPGQRADG